MQEVLIPQGEKMLLRRNHTANALFATTGVAAVLFSLASTSGATATPTPKPTVAKPVVCATTPGIDESTIRIGLVSARTGASAPFYAGFNEAAKLRFDQENAKGGVNGRKFVTYQYDDQATGSVQSVVITKALAQDDVFGIIEASTADTMFPVLSQSNVPTIGLSNLPAQGTDRNAFGVTGAFSPAYANTSGARRMADAGITKLAVINHNSPAAQAAGNGLAVTAPLEGMSIAVRIADAPIGIYDATSTALRIKQAGADGVNTILLVDGGVAVMSALKQQGLSIGNGLKGALISGLTDPVTITKAGPAVEGAIGSPQGTVPVGVPNRPGLRTYTNGMKAAGLNPYGPNPPLGFASADTMIRGLKLAGKCPTRASVIDQLRAAKSITAGGLLPEPINYNPGLTPNGDPARCIWYITVKNGQMVPDAKATCGKILEVSTGKVVRG